MFLSPGHLKVFSKCSKRLLFIIIILLLVLLLLLLRNIIVFATKRKYNGHYIDSDLDKTADESQKIAL